MKSRILKKYFDIEQNIRNGAFRKSTIYKHPGMPKAVSAIESKGKGPEKENLAFYQTGGWVRGGFGKRPDFFRFFSSAPCPYPNIFLLSLCDYFVGNSMHSYSNYWKIINTNEIQLTIVVESFGAPSLLTVKLGVT